MNKKQVIKDFFVYSAGNYISQAAGFFSGFLLRAFLEPYYMGIWQALNIVTSYASYINLGTAKSAEREIAYFKGKGNDAKVEALKNTGFTFSILTVFIISASCIGFALYDRANLDKYIFWGFIVIGIMVVLERIESYIVTVFRSKQLFFYESVNKGIIALVNLALIILIVRAFKLPGLYIMNILITCISITILLVLSKERFKLQIDQDILKHLIKVGIPLALLGFVFVNLINMDKLIILKMLGAEKLGIYSIATMSANVIYGLSTIGGIILYPRYQQIYAKNDSKNDIYVVIQKVIKLAWFPLLLLAGCVIIVFPYLIVTFIPKYTAGIPAMKILICGMYFLSLSLFYDNFLVTINKQAISILVCLAAIGVNIACSLFFIKMGWGIKGVALGTSISYLAHFIIVSIVSFYLRMSKHDKNKGKAF